MFDLLTSEEVFEGGFHFWDTFAYPKEPELKPEDPSKKLSLPIAQRVHTLTARTLKRTHWLYEPESFVPAAQLVETYDRHAQRITGTDSIAYSSSVSTASATVEPQLYYIHTTHLGTPQELTDRNGNLQWIGQYRAWGELAKASDSEGNAANVEMPLRFQGQYFDKETGLHYNRFRYYDPKVGRFTTQDPISLAGGINLYQYAPNPMLWVDPLGLDKFLYRSMSMDEYSELNKTGRWSANNGSMESKWFAESYNDANQWGKTMGHGGDYMVVQIKVPDDVYHGAYSNEHLDGIGKAKCIEISELNKANAFPRWSKKITCE